MENLPERLKKLFIDIEEFRKELLKKGCNPKNIPVSIENMRIVAQERIKKPIISQYTKSINPLFVYGISIKTTEQALILIPEELKKEGMEAVRVSFTKELCHILFDPKDSWNTKPIETISDVVENNWDIMSQNNNCSIRSKSSREEELAKIGMLELLYPRELRTRDREDILSQRISYRELAKRMEIQPWLVSFVFKKKYKDLNKFYPDSV